MRYLHIVLILCGLCLAMPAPEAVAAKDTAYLAPKIFLPVWSNDPLRVLFRADEAACRKAYGDDWESCNMSLAESGAQAPGVVLLGQGQDLPAGEWRWEDYETLIFTPRTAWKETTAFTLDMTKLVLPLRAKVNTRVIKGETLPFSALADQGEVWVDPSPTGERALSFALRFTAPVDAVKAKELEKGMTLKADTANPVGLTPLQVVWGQDKNSCVVKTVITALPDNDTVLTLNVPGVRPLKVEDVSYYKVGTALTGTLQQRVTVPGKKQLFQVTMSNFELVTTDKLTRHYELALKTSLRVSAAELVKALQVVELPRLQNAEGAVPYEWNQAPAITQADLAKARPLKVDLVSDPGQSGEPILLRVAASAGAFVHCQLPTGFGPAGYTLDEPWTAVYYVSESSGMVAFLQPGHVLALTPGGDNRLDIVTTGVDSVRWRASRIPADRLNFLQIMTPYSGSKFAIDSYMEQVGTVVEGTITLPGGAADKMSPRFASLSLAELMRGGTGFMQVELEGLHNGQSVAGAKRLVMATDLGMVSKLVPEGGRQVYVASLSSGKPVPNALVRILGANGQSVAEARTDAAGYALLPAVRGLQREKAPVALVASLSTAANAADVADMAWMALDDSARRVDSSAFGTQGQKSSADNINAYVFGQRGIFRPGEVLRFGVMTRRGNWQDLPADMPLVATLTDPAGRVALRHNFTVGQGLADISWNSLETSPTGRYRLDVTLPAAGGSGEILGSGVVRVEEFQPDTMAIRTELLQGEAKKTEVPLPSNGWLVSSDKERATLGVFLRNFYGMPAEGRKVRAEFSVRPAALAFAAYEDFTFPDILPLPNAGENAPPTPLPQTLTSAAGEAELPLPLAAYQGRTMAARVLVEGFEGDGGRAVTAEKTFLVSPLKVMLGYRPHGLVSYLGYVPKGARGGLEFVALRSDLTPATPNDVGQLHFSVAERRYMRVLATDAQGKYVYEENPVDTDIATSSAALDDKGCISWNMPTDNPGEYLLTVRDDKKQLMARIEFTVAGNDDVQRATDPKTQNMFPTQMRLRLDKADYNPGDTANVFISAPFDGVALMTLERDRVVQHLWLNVPAGNSVHSLNIPRDFEGRGYVNVTMGRSVTSPEIFMQPLSHAVASLTVNAAGRDMGLRVQAPADVLPGGSIKARITARQPGKALVFAVDEGVLQLTRFTTPEPLRYLLLDRALEVQTDQIFDILMPVHTQLAKRLPAFGGDMHMGGGRFYNPFKRRTEPPLAWWSGLVDVGPEGSYVTIPVPSYTNSQVRIMVVGVSASTVGHAEGQVVARAPLVISPQLPLMAAPGDTFEGGMGLHNTTGKSLAVELASEVTGLQVEKALPEKVEIAAGKEVFLPLRLVAGATPGEAAMTVTARVDAGQAFKRTTTLSVRPAVLPYQDQATGFAPVASDKEQGKGTPAAKSSATLKDGQLPADVLKRPLYTFKADAVASVSTTPLPPLRMLLRFLEAYPYDCVEQSLSRALPLVLLHRHVGLREQLMPADNRQGSTETPAAVQARTLERAITALRAAHRSGSGVAPWPDANTVNSLLTAYAGDYLLSLKEAGLNVPGDLSTSFFATLREMVSGSPESLAEGRAMAYGLWVLTRHGLVTTQWLDSLRDTLTYHWPDWKKDVTATFIAGSYAIMNMHTAAQELLDAGGAGELLEAQNAFPLTRLGARGLHVAVLARHFPDRLADQAGTLAGRLMEGVSVSRGSTMESALGARALLELLAPLKEAEAGLAGMELRCTAYQPGFEPKGDVATLSPEANALSLLSLSAPGCTQFSLNAPNKIPVYWQVSSDGFDRTPPAKPAATGMEVTRVLKLVDGTVLDSNITVAQGTILRVELSGRVPRNDDTATSVVLVDMLPGGVELVLNHPDDSIPESDDAATYTRLDRREDRVVAYTAVQKEPVTFVYHVRAVNRGSYVLPAAYGEALYDRGMNSHTVAGVLTVQ